MSENWRIERLCELAGLALSESSYDGTNSARVRDLPDVRTMRYYTTLGLIDRPAEMRGRTAYYSQKHLQQLVAIKRLQSQGHSLASIQVRMVGISKAQLTRLADLPEDFLKEVASRTPPRKKRVSPASEKTNTAKDPSEGNEAPSVARTKFWAQVPDIHGKHAVETVESLAPTPAVVVPLVDGISLLVEGVHADQLDPALLLPWKSAAASLKEALRGSSPTSASAGEIRPGERTSTADDETAES